MFRFLDDKVTRRSSVISLSDLPLIHLCIHFNMDFSAKITEYKESNSSKSPVWIWFDNEKDHGKCQICHMCVKTSNFATTNLILHLKRHHGFLKKYNAFQEFQKLTELKEERVRNSKRKKSEADDSEEPVSKQPKIADAINAAPYGPEHPRQQSMTNAIAQMICVDAVPTNIVTRKGFQNFVQKCDSRYTLPNVTTFSRNVIPKLNNVVQAHQLNRIQEMIKRECSMAFSTDGLDGRDAERSAIYDFRIYFYEETEISAEVIRVKSLDSTDGESVANFLKQCLTDIKVLDSDGKPKLDIWGVTDEGSNVVRALNILKGDFQ